MGTRYVFVSLISHFFRFVFLVDLDPPSYRLDVRNVGGAIRGFLS